MEACCDLIAGAGDTMGYRIDADLHGNRSISDIVTRQADACGAEGEVHAILNRLQRAGILILDEDGLGMRLPLPVKPTSSLKAESNRANGRSSIGRPRKDETPEAYQRRQAEERLRAAAQAGQRSMLYQMPGGIAETQTETQTETRPETQTTGFFQPIDLKVGFGVGFHAPVAAAASSCTGIIDSIEDSAAAAADFQGTTRPPAPAPKNPSDISEKPKSHEKPTAEEKPKPDAEAGGDPPSAPADPTERERWQEARRLNDTFRSLFASVRESRRKSEEVFHALLKDGFAFEAMAAVMAEKRGTPVSSAAYIGTILRQEAHRAANSIARGGKTPALTPQQKVLKTFGLDEDGQDDGPVIDHIEPWRALG